MSIDALLALSRATGDGGAPQAGSVWAGVVAGAPAPNGVEVTLPDFGPARFGPCPYPTTGPAPTRGDSCLVVFDNNRDPWVVIVWP
jgi:hypothetical protein